eukprot:TRINITY_DN993_c0_g1_i1.p1 TRINITY_DN993_c0_g1~~TRINITY_DN993_c0_g1_i1.p1  ORF type:complete len:380 (-),score=25.09 TRINITY_DN993_c0_g1_i1:23-1162(-)
MTPNSSFSNVLEKIYQMDAELVGRVWSFLVWGGLVFAIFFVLFSLVHVVRSRKTPTTWFFWIMVAIIPCALYFTWKNMILMTLEDMKLCNSTDFWSWLTKSQNPVHRNQSLFFEAYVRVTKSRINWWFSSQVLGFVLSMVVLFFTESYRSGLRMTWAIIWLGFAVAISVALPVFLCMLELSKRDKPRDGSGISLFRMLLLFVATIVGFMSYLYIPISSNADFRFWVVVGHSIVFLPFVGCARSDYVGMTQRKALLFTVMIYIFLAGVMLSSSLPWALGMLNEIESQLEGAWTYRQAFEFVIKRLFYSCYAQASITWDLVFIWIESCLWFIFRAGPVGFLFVLMACVLPISVVFPMFLIYRSFVLYVADTEKIASKSKTE